MVFVGNFFEEIFVRLEIMSTFAVPKGKNASLAQLVEHDTLNVGVQGSRPWGLTRISASIP